MTRATGALILVAMMAAVAAAPGCVPSYDFDIVISGGTIVDGSGKTPYVSDIGIRDDRIVTIGPLSSSSAWIRLSAKGRVVAPGFINTLGQSGAYVVSGAEPESHILQGITSEIIGETNTPALWWMDSQREESPMPRQGLWRDFGGYFKALTQRGVALNIGSLVPVNQLRGTIMRGENRPATPDELARMQETLAQAMEQGALGLSAALAYAPASSATTDELIALASVSARYGGVYATHIRSETFRLLDAIDEAISIGSKAALPVIIFHLKAAGHRNWHLMPAALDAIERARQRGLQVSANAYPYTVAQTSLLASIPKDTGSESADRPVSRLADRTVRENLRRQIEDRVDSWGNIIMASGFDHIYVASGQGIAPQSLGRSIADLAASAGRSNWDMLFDLIVESNGTAGAWFDLMNEANVAEVMRRPWVTIGSDSSATTATRSSAAGLVHPRAFGTFPRVLGKYVRQDSVLTLEEAIRRMTSLAAAQFGIRDRGLIAQGYCADIVIFDPRTVADTSTFEQPHRYPLGIEAVIVNGKIAAKNGQYMHTRAGRPLQRRR